MFNFPQGGFSLYLCGAVRSDLLNIYAAISYCFHI